MFSRRTKIALAAFALVGTTLSLTRDPLHRYFFDENLLEIVPGEIWRSAQPSGPEMDAFITRLGLRSVLNLRGERGGSAWLREERSVTAARGVELHTVRLSAKQMPPTPRLREIVRVLDTAPRPLLLHCKGGVERSGLVGAVAVLLHDGDLAQARAQFARSKGYIQILSGSELPLVLDEYERWLSRRGETHAPERFRAWVAGDYHPYFYRAGISATGVPAQLVSGRENTMRFRVTNRSLRPIPFRAARDHGVHLGARLRAAGAEEPIELRDGFVDVDLAPGDTREFDLTLPPLEPGSFLLEVDLVDEGYKWFQAMGSTPLLLPLELVREG